MRASTHEPGHPRANNFGVTLDAVKAELRELDTEEIWAKIQAVPRLGPDPILPSDAKPGWKERLIPWTFRAYPTRTELVPIAAGTAYGLSLMGTVWAVVIAVPVLLVFGALWFIGEPRPFRYRTLEEARDGYRHREQQFRDEYLGAAFEAKREALRKVRAQLIALRDGPPEAQPSMQREVRTELRRRYLAAFALADADIPGLDSHSREVLARQWITTADNVRIARLSKMPGLDAEAVEAVRRWRDGLLRRFRFDPDAQLTAAERERIEQRFRKRKSELAYVFIDGPRDLQNRRDMIREYRPFRLHNLRREWASLQMMERRHRRRAGRVRPPR